MTGGTGYLGSHISIVLQNAGYQVVIVDNLSNSRADVIDRIEEISGLRPVLCVFDLRDADSLKSLFLAHSFDAVIHCAGLKVVHESVAKPLQYYDNNLGSSISLFRAMNDAGVRNLVFSSSANVYGIPETLPVKESAPRQATNPYGQSKLMIEDILSDMSLADHRWKIVLLRYFNPVGAHESGLIGEAPEGSPNNLMPYLARVATGELPYLNVYGNDYPTRDGTGVRDYIHVMDLAEGHLRALHRLSECSEIESYNLGTGQGYSVMEMISAFEEASGKKVPFKVVGRRANDIPESYADVSRAYLKLGWKAERGLENMCGDEWRWQLSRMSRGA